MKITKSSRDGVASSMAGHAPAGGVTVIDSGGFFTGTTLEEILAEIGAGTSPGSFLTVVGGGKGTVQAHGTLGATETIDVSLANYHWGTLDQACTVTFTGWTTLKDCQIAVEVLEDGTGGWTPTFSGVTWLGGVTPTHSTTASSSTIYVFLSRDGGTTIYGAQAGSGSAGGFLSVINGGGGTVQVHGSMGATETIDTLNGNYHWGTLNANCTFTFTTTVDTAERWFTLELIEDGTGGWTVTWPASVMWVGGTTPDHDTTLATSTFYTFFTRNGGTTWIGGQLGGATSAEDVSELVAAGGHVHIDNVTFSGDAVTTAFALPAVPVDAFSVAAYVTGVRTAVTLSGTLLDIMTFGSAPAAAADNIIVDITAVLV